jgi:biotin carboxylase
MADATIMIAGSGRQKYREYELQSIGGRYEVVVLSPHKITWERPYVRAWRVIDFEDDQLFQSAGSQFAGATGATGLMTWSDRVGERCARLARSRGMPFAQPAAIRACKDKIAFRDLLRDEPGSAVRSKLVHGLAGARRAADEIGYPVVIKPRALGGSIGVLRVDDERDLERGLPSAFGASVAGLPPLYPGVVVEEYLQGKEYSVDCLSLRGETFPLVVAEKMLGPEPYFEETGHIVPAPPSPELDAALKIVCKAHRTLGVECLATHAEFRLTAAGPRLIEINARLGGGLIPRLGCLALGIELPLAAADVAMGREPRLRASQRCVAAIRFFYPESDMEVSHVELRGSRHDGLIAFETLVRPGAQLTFPPRGFKPRLGYAIVTGADREECIGRLNAVEADLWVRGRPV